jgi:hypothetical protein
MPTPPAIASPLPCQPALARRAGTPDRRPWLALLPILLLVTGCGERQPTSSPAADEGATAGTVTLRPVTPGAAGAPSPRAAGGLDETSRRELLALVRSVLADREPPPTPSLAARDRLERVVVSLARPAATALVGQGAAPDLATAARRAADEVRRRAQAVGASVDERLKIDVVTRLSDPSLLGPIPSTGEGYAPGLDGLWFPAAELLLLPEEIQARNLVELRMIERERLVAYLAEGPRTIDGEATAIADRALAERAEVHRVRFSSWIEDEGEPAPLYRGNRELPATSPDALLAAARAGGEFLLRHQTASGLLAYQYRPSEDDFTDTDNLVRQAGTAYSLVELADATGDLRFRSAAERVITALLGRGRSGPPAPEGVAARTLAITEDNGEAKLGASALALLAITRCRAAGGCADQGRTAEELAAYLLSQQRADGSFVSKVDLDTGEVDDFESIYYPGEAILALLRLASQVPEGPWAVAATRGARWLITVRDADKSDAELPHDHWLLMGLAELVRREPLNPLWTDHARRIAGAIVRAQHRAATEPDWIGGYYDPPRATPTATRGEGLVAMAAIARQRQESDAAWIEAMRLGAEFQLRCQLMPESTLYLRRPDRALGGMRKGLTGWAVRIDYVQHSISAFLGLRALQLEP